MKNSLKTKFIFHLTYNIGAELKLSLPGKQQMLEHFAQDLSKILI